MYVHVFGIQAKVVQQGPGISWNAEWIYLKRKTLNSQMENIIIGIDSFVTLKFCISLEFDRLVHPYNFI